MVAFSSFIILSLPDEDYPETSEWLFYRGKNVREERDLMEEFFDMVPNNNQGSCLGCLIMILLVIVFCFATVFFI